MFIDQNPVLVFDIETIPDASGLRKLQWVAGSSDQEDDATIVQHALAQREQATGSSFLPLHLHRIVAISCVFRDASQVRVRSLGGLEDSEPDLIRAFFKTIDRYTPQLVSWNGGGFDLPVLHYRALIHQIQATRYWDLGQGDRDFKWNNYLNRYHTRHLDLMDVLASYTPRAYAPLDDLAKLCGFAGKLGMDGSKVWDAYQNGQLSAIRDYCETDVVNTYLTYIRFEHMAAHLTDDQYQEEVNLVRQTLKKLPGEQWKAYLEAWPEAGTESCAEVINK